MSDQFKERINWIDDTPLGIAVRNITFISPHAHEDIIEITLCLEGKVTFDYCFEEFRIKAGEFILVDRDTHYMHSGDDALIASFYIDLRKVSDEYRQAASQCFICEGTSDSDVPYNTYEHRLFRGMLISILNYILKYDWHRNGFSEDICRVTNRIMELVYYKFDLINYRCPNIDFKEKELIRYKNTVSYMFCHSREKLQLKDISEPLGISSGYLSMLLSRTSSRFEELITYIRTWSAERMLLTTDKSISEISYECGFSAPKYLYAGFRFWYKCTPGEYRYKYRREMNKPDNCIYLNIQDVENQIIQRICKSS